MNREEVIVLLKQKREIFQDKLAKCLAIAFGSWVIAEKDSVEDFVDDEGNVDDFSRADLLHEALKFDDYGEEFDKHIDKYVTPLMHERTTPEMREAWEFIPMYMVEIKAFTKAIELLGGETK